MDLLQSPVTLAAQHFDVGGLQLHVLLRLLVSAACGMAIGMEREKAGKPAGLRTNILICLGAALFTVLSLGIAALANDQNVAQNVAFRADPGRIAAQIVVGVGFIGGGAILHAKQQIIGLTSAATIWVVAAIGMAAGAGAFVIAIGTTVLVLVILVPLGWWERRHRTNGTVLYEENGRATVSNGED
jgi:putative Mg2+ transporter-C (MgtC) family protein